MESDLCYDRNLPVDLMHLRKLKNPGGSVTIRSSIVSPCNEIRVGSSIIVEGDCCTQESYKE
jgi:hypothetical protein